MPAALGELALRYGCRLVGDPEQQVHGVATLSGAGPTDLAFLANPHYRRQLAGTSAGAVVLGVSKDSVESHEKFVAKRDLTVPMLSDEHGTTCEDYGVWKEKSMYGKSYMGIERTTVLSGGDGAIVRVWTKCGSRRRWSEVSSVGT